MIPRRLRNLCLTALFVGLVTAAIAFVLKARRVPVPSLDGLQALLANKQYDEVELRLADHLRADPANPQANLLMAQVALDRDAQKPELALDYLSRVKARDPRMRAMVLLNQGKAYSVLAQNDLAEAAWNQALRVDPGTPEAGWALLSMYYVQRRREEAHRLVFLLRRNEPDARDRAQLLLELVRHDARPITLERLIDFLEPLARQRPQDLQTSIALGLALVRNSRLGEGHAILQDLVERFGTHPDSWDALLLGLDEAGKFDDLADELSRVPPEIATDPRFDRYRATVAQQRQDWQSAVEFYNRSWRRDPSDFRVLYRLSRVLRAAGRPADADAFDQKVRAAQDAKDQILPLYEEANAVKTLGTAPHPDLYHRLADLRERMGRDDEAVAWHGMVLEHQSDNKESNAAIARLNAAKADITASH
jgi:tetratricopeptide (TPR) repeat protein